jgi:hypothetical protein
MNIAKECGIYSEGEGIAMEGFSFKLTELNLFVIIIFFLNI